MNIDFVKKKNAGRKNWKEHFGKKKLGRKHLGPGSGQSKVPVINYGLATSNITENS